MPSDDHNPRGSVRRFLSTVGWLSILIIGGGVLLLASIAEIARWVTWIRWGFFS